MNLGELFVQIGAIGNSKEVKAFGAAVKKAGDALDKYDKQLKNAQGSGQKATLSIKGTIGAIAGIAGAVAGAYWALDRLTDSLAKQNLQWLNLTRQSDIALSTFQKWGTIGKIVGVDNAAQQLENLNQKIFNLRLTGEGAKGFQMAGIMPTNAEDVLEQLRGRIAGMSNTTATYLLQQMGLDPKMITLLRMGREEWEEYLEVSRKYALTDKQREDIDYYNRQLQVARIKIQYFKDKAILALMPAFTKLTTSLVRVFELLLRIANVIKKPLAAFILFGDRLKGLVGLTRGLSHNLTRLIIKSIRFAAVFRGLGAVFARALFPLTALYLILDDLAVFFQGGDSLIGRVLEWGKEKGGAIAEGFKQMFGGDVFGGLGNIFESLLDALIDILDVLKNLGDIIVNAITFGIWRQFRNSGFGKFLFGDLNSMLKDNGIDPTTGKRMPTLSSAMSGNAKYLTNNRNQNTTINQTNYIQTEQPANELEWSLRYWQQQAQR